MEKLAGVVYQIPYQCGKVYVGETQRCLGTEHRDACNKGYAGKSAIAEHQWDQQHQVNWEGIRVLDRASRPVQLRVKETLYIHKTPTNNRLNRDEGYELPGCWIATVKKLGSGLAQAALAPTALVLGPLHWTARTCKLGATPINCHHFCTSLHFCPVDD